jgi:hypothetical protein
MSLVFDFPHWVKGKSSVPPKPNPNLERKDLRSIFEVISFF